MLSADQLIHRVTLRRYRGEVDGQAAYADPVIVACYLETRQVLLEPQAAEELGVETGLEGTLYANEPDLPAGSLLTISGLGGYVGQVTRYDDGSELDHQQVEVTPRPPTAAQRTATIDLIDPTATTTEWDAVNEVTVETRAAAYATGVPATIAEAATSSRVEVAEEVLRIAPMLLRLHRDAAPQVGHIAVVTAAPGDALLVGRRLRVEHIVLGSQRLDRELYCSLD